MRLAALIVWTLVVSSPVLAAAQDTRASILAEQEAARARSLTPPQPEPGERLVGLFDGPPQSGWLPSFGGLIPGGGLNVGAIYTRFFGDASTWQARGVYSIHGFALVSGQVLVPGLWRDRAQLRLYGELNNGPRVEFFGIGNDSHEANRAFYAQRRLDAGAELTLRAHRFVVLGGGVEALARRARPRDDEPLDATFPPSEIPGFDTDLRFTHAVGRAAIDWRPAPHYATSGGLYQLTAHRYAASDRAFSFDRVDVDLVQHVPVLRNNWIISLRARASSTMTDEGAEVPFHMLPRIGGSDGVRGYGAYRFVDRHAAILSGEYRWTPGKTLDMAIFWDTGVVAPERRGLSLRRAHSSWGVGARFHTPAQTALRIELAVGREGPHLIFAVSPAF